MMVFPKAETCSKQWIL